MTPYPLVKFGDVVRQVKDKVDPQTAGLERYVAGEHMDTDNLHIRRWGDVGAGYLGPAFNMRFKPGQVLYGSRRTYLRKVAVAEFEGITANTTYVIESKDPEVLLPELLPFIMQTDSFNEHSIKQSKGSVNPYINFSDITWYEFPLPPVDEQRRIADLLWAADNAVTEWNDTLEKLDTLYEAFLEDSLLAVQSDGSLFDVDEICKEVTVGIVVNPSKYYADSGIIAISHSKIFRGEIDITNVSYFTPASHNSLKKTWLYSGDVVLPRVSTIAGRPYYAAVVPEELNEINAIGVIILRPDSGKVNPYYLEAYLNAQSIRRRLVGVAVGSIQRQLNVGIIAKEKVFIPSFEKQNEIATKSITFKKNIRQMKEHLDKQVSLKNNLLRHVLTGK